MADALDMEEKAGAEKTTYTTTSLSDDDASRPVAPSPVREHGILAKMRYYENALDRRFGIESHGPARVLPEERDPAYGSWSNQATMALLWASGTMNLSCFTTGFLGWELGLSLKQTILITIFGSLLGGAVTVCQMFS